MTNRENFLKVVLHTQIVDKQDAWQYITELTYCGLNYHLDDDVNDIIFSEYQPTEHELKCMDARQIELWNLDWDDKSCPHGIMIKAMNNIDNTFRID